MDGREYVLEAIGRAERVLDEVKSSSALNGDPLLEGIAKACGALGQVKNRPSLRTRTGSNLVYPVYEAAKNLEEAWEEDRGKGDGKEFRSRIEEFLSAVETLTGALRERTVIMT